MKADRDEENDFEEMNDVHENIGSFTCSMTVPETLSDKPKSI